MEFCIMTKTLSDWCVLSWREFVMRQQNSIDALCLSLWYDTGVTNLQDESCCVFRKALHICVYGVLAGSVRRLSPTVNSDSPNRCPVPILLKMQLLPVNERYYPQIDSTVCGCFPYIVCISHRIIFTDLTKIGHKTLSIWDSIFNIRLSVSQTEENYHRLFVIQTSWVTLSI
jgi:hypothetical protein